MAQSNPIYSHDLYQPGPEDQLKLLHARLAQLQLDMKNMTKMARTLKAALDSIRGNSAGGNQNITQLALQVERLKQQLERTRQAQIRTQAELHRLTVAQNQAASSANRLSITQTQAAAAAQRLANAQAAANRQATQGRSSFSGLLGSIRNLTYAYFSLSAAQQIVGKLFSETKTLNTLDIALKQTLGSIQSVTEAKQFLLDITERYGADLLTTSNAYLKFGTAAKQAGVSAQDTRNIFESVTKASSVLGLGAERTSYVFLALEQIMSKGRLSTEELRRQLGEHLPGAFGIAAKAMKVTTAELTDMLKKGEIASTDFLPKFAKELEKTYGIENLKRVDNLAAAQGRFNNEITLLIQQLNVAGAFKDFFDNLASGVKFIGQNIDGTIKLARAVIELVAAYTAYKVLMIANRALSAFFLVDTLRQLTATKALEAAQLRLSFAIKAVSAAWKTNPFGVILTAATALFVGLDYLIDKLDGVKKAQKDLSDAKASGSAAVRIEQFQIDQLTALYGENEKKLALLKSGTDKYNEVADQQAGILRRLTSLGVEVVDSNNDQKISQQELTTATEAYLVKLRQRVEAEKLIADRAAAIEKISDLKQGQKGVNLLNENGLLLLADKAFGTTYTNIGKQAAIDQYEAYIKEIEKQITALGDPFGLLGGASDSGNGGGGGGDETGTKKDPRLVEIERLKYLNSLRREGMAKDLEALALNLAEKRILYEKDAEVLAKLEEYKWQQIQAIREKYVSIEADRQEQDTKDLIEGLNTVAESVAKAFAARASGNLGQTAEQKQTEFDLQQAHEKRLFELHEENADKREKFDIQQEIDLINFKLKLNEQYGGLLNEKEIQRLNELRDALQIELGKPIKADKKEVDIFSLLGIDFGGDNDKLDAFKSTIKIVGDELSSFVDLQKELVDQQIEDADRLVRSKEEALNRQIALAAANQANNVAGAQAELALAKKTQEEALKQRKKVQKQELALDTLAQSSNIITAITAALKLGPILGPIAVGAILATFAASKIKALALINKKTFRKGGYREIGGGTHESGNDTHVGGNNWAEKDESVGIFNKNATKKYKPTLKAFVNAANKGTLDKILFQDRRAIQGITNNYGPRVDTSVMEKRLGRLVSLTEKKSYVDGSGNLVINDRGRTTIVRNGSK